MSNVDFKNNFICKYAFLIIIWSLFFYIMSSLKKIIFCFIFLNSLTNMQILSVHGFFLKKFVMHKI